MSGLRFDDFFPPVISSKTHSIIDYIHAGTNFVAAAMFYKRGDRKAGHAATALGASVLMNALMTDYHYGVFRVWNFKTHGILDYGVAATSAALPKILNLYDTADAAYFYGQGGGETTIAGLTNYDDNSGARHHFGSSSRRYRDRWAA
ncbi:MAG TPA: hypothetical protein VMT82_00240 [candidate division Zixibacteria bacterium]|nr:hypothetical protein [candidate division Zixibacteria bacterium]